MGACKNSEKKAKAPGYCERDWITEIGFKQINPQLAEFNCVIAYGDIPEFIGHYEATPDPTLPKLIYILTQHKNFRCYAGIDDIQDKATELKVGDFPTFRKALLNKNRVMPYIFVSPQKPDGETEGAELLINPKRLAYVVCGNARVFFPSP